MDPRMRAMIDRVAALYGHSAVALNLGTGTEADQDLGPHRGDGRAPGARAAARRPTGRRRRVAGLHGRAAMPTARCPVRIGHGRNGRSPEDNLP